MKKAMPVLKSLWFLMIIALVFIGRDINFAALVLLTLIALLAPIIREVMLKADLDERQIYISHYSSHVAYFAYSFLIVFVVTNELMKQGQVTLLIFLMLLLIPMLVKILIIFFKRYGSNMKRLSDYLRLFFRGIVPSHTADERQHVVGNFSSHIAFYVFLTLTISVILINFIRVGTEPPTLWYMLLIVPLLSKLFTSFLMTYGAVRGAQFIGSTIVLFHFAFTWLEYRLAHGSQSFYHHYHRNRSGAKNSTNRRSNFSITRHWAGSFFLCPGLVTHGYLCLHFNVFTDSDSCFFKRHGIVDSSEGKNLGDWWN